MRTQEKDVRKGPAAFLVATLVCALGATQARADAGRTDQEAVAAAAAGAQAFVGFISPAAAEAAGAVMQAAAAQAAQAQGAEIEAGPVEVEEELQASRAGKKEAESKQSRLRRLTGYLTGDSAYATKRLPKLEGQLDQMVEDKGYADKFITGFNPKDPVSQRAMGYFLARLQERIKGDPGNKALRSLQGRLAVVVRGPVSKGEP